MIYQVKYVRKLYRIFRIYRGLILRCVVILLMIYLYAYIFGTTKTDTNTPDLIYNSRDHVTIHPGIEQSYTVNQEVQEEEYEDIVPPIDNVPSSVSDDRLNTYTEIIPNLSDPSETVTEDATHGCPEWFENTMDENLNRISTYPRGDADSYWQFIGGNFTSPIFKVTEFPVIVTASDYYHNRQIVELYESVKKYVMPKFKVIKIIVYDIGMYPHHPKLIRRACNICEIRKFPFNDFPDHINPDTLKNYAWKPLIVRRVLSEFSWVWWMDASIQFTNNDLQQALQYSIQNAMLFFTAGSTMSVAKHTHPKTFEYLQEDKCKFNNLGEVTAGFVLYHYDKVTRTLVDAWAACALNKQCISPDDALEKIDCASVDDVTGTDSRHVCHRFDQSILGILLRRLFHDKNFYPDVTNNIDIYKINRLEFYYMSDEDVPYYYANKLPSFNSINRH